MGGGIFGPHLAHTHSRPNCNPCAPAENLVAACQGKPARLLGVARTSTDARVLLEALEVGMDGVVLRTDNSMEVANNSMPPCHWSIDNTTLRDDEGQGARHR